MPVQAADAEADALPHRQGRRAAVEPIEHARIAQHQAVRGEEVLVTRQRIQARRAHRHGRHQPGIGIAQALGGACLHGGALGQQRDVVGGALLLAATDTLGHARVVAVALPGQQLAVPGPRLGGGQAATGVDLGQATQFGEIECDDLRTLGRQPRQRGLERLRHLGLHAIHHKVTRDVEAQAGQVGGPGVERLAAQHGVHRHAAGHRARQRAGRIE
ncbi:hypothetical protein D3C86_1631160 [compost metagenome]